MPFGAAVASSSFVRRSLIERIHVEKDFGGGADFVIASWWRESRKWHPFAYFAFHSEDKMKMTAAPNSVDMGILSMRERVSPPLNTDAHRRLRTEKEILCLHLLTYYRLLYACSILEVVSRITLSLFWVFLSRIKVEKRRSTQAAFELLARREKSSLRT